MTQKTVGLDIGSSYLRAVEITTKNKEITVQKIGQVPLPKGVISGSKILDREIFQQKLKLLWKNNNFSTKKVRLGISSETVLARSVQKDWMQDADLSRVLSIVVKEDLPAAANEYYLDFHTVGEFEEDGVRKKHIFLTGAPRKIIDEIVYSVQSAGFSPISIDVVGLSLLRTAQHDSTGVNINVDIGALNSTIIISRKNQPLYLRVISNNGGYLIDDAIIDTLDLSGTEKFDDAEKKKLVIIQKSAEVAAARSQKNKIDSIFDSEKVPEIKVTEEMITVSRALTSTMVTIVSRIHDALDDYFRREKSHKISSFTISGGLAGIPNITSRLSSEFKTNVTLLDIPVTTTKPYEYAVAYGLALGTGASHE